MTKIYIFYIDPYERIFEIYSTKEKAEVAREEHLKDEPHCRESFEDRNHGYGDIEEYELDEDGLFIETQTFKYAGHELGSEGVADGGIKDAKILAKGKAVFVKEDDEGYRHYKFEPPLPPGTNMVMIEGLGVLPVDEKNQKKSNKAGEG